MRNEVCDTIGWLLCETAFRSWDLVGEYDWLVNWYARPCYSLGSWFYGRASR